MLRSHPFSSGYQPTTMAPGPGTVRGDTAMHHSNDDADGNTTRPHAAQGHTREFATTDHTSEVRTKRQICEVDDAQDRAPRVRAVTRSLNGQFAEAAHGPDVGNANAHSMDVRGIPQGVHARVGGIVANIAHGAEPVKLIAPHNTQAATSFVDIGPRKGVRFFGREAQLKDMHRALQHASLPSDVGTLWIHSLPGYGKSALAREFARLYCREYVAVFEVAAAKLADSFADVAARAGLSPVVNSIYDDFGGREKRAAAVATAVRAWLRGLEGKWLVIVDGADSRSRDARFPWTEYLPSHGGHVIVTSCFADATTRTQHFVPFKLEGMCDATAAQFFDAKTQRDREAVADIVRECCGSPLLLSGAARHIASVVGMSPAGYVAKMKGTIAVHADGDRDAYRPTDYCASTSNRWDIALDCIGAESDGGKEALDALCVCAQLCDKNIPVEWVTKLADPAGVGLSLLRAYGMVDVAGAEGVACEDSEKRPWGPTIDLNRLVQSVVRTKKAATDEWNAWLDTTLEQLEDVFEFERNDAASCARAKVAVPHVDSVCALVPASHPLLQYAIRMLFSRHILTDESDDAAIARLQGLLSLCRTVDAESGDVALALSLLGDAYEERGMHADALANFDASLQIYRKLHGDEHVIIAEVLHHKGNMHACRHEYAQAIATFESALAIRRKLKGEDSEVACLLTSLSGALRAVGRLSESMATVKKSLRIMRIVRNGDTEHPSFAEIHHELGLGHLALGQYVKAKANFESALRIDRKAQNGDDNAQVAWSLLSIGEVEYRLAHYDGALRFAEDALSICRALPADVDDGGGDFAAKLLIGKIRLEQGLLDEAKTALLDAFALETKAHPADGPDMALLKVQYGRLLLLRRDYDSALQTCREALTALTNIRSESHPEVAEARRVIGDVLAAKCMLGEALREYDRALAAFRGVAESHPDVAETLFRIGKVRAAQNDLVGAASLLASAAQMLSRFVDENHPRYVAVMQQSSQVHRSLRKAEEAQKRREMCEAIAEEIARPPASHRR